MNLQEQIDKTIRTIPDFPKEGIMFKDITPILEDAKLTKAIVARLVQDWKGKVDAVAGVESRGFLFGMSMAIELGVPFVLIRKKGKLPHKTVSHEYDLEYGNATIEMHIDSVKKNMKVLVHDDLLATGGTAAAAAALIQKAGGEVAGFSFLIELAFLEGTKKLEKYNEKSISLISY